MPKNSHAINSMWLVLDSLLYPHTWESLLVSQGMSTTFHPYLTFIAAEHIREGVEFGIQVSNGRRWIEQCFHYKGVKRELRGYGF